MPGQLPGPPVVGSVQLRVSGRYLREWLVPMSRGAQPAASRSCLMCVFGLELCSVLVFSGFYSRRGPRSFTARASSLLFVCDVSLVCVCVCEVFRVVL